MKIENGVVFAIIYGGPEESGDGFSGRLVAYELESGEVRWDYQGDVTREGLDPWRAENGQVFTLGANLEVRDTDTGEVVWKTSYPKSQHPNLRILGADADDDTLYVGFATAFGSGD